MLISGDQYSIELINVLTVIYIEQMTALIT